MCSPEEHDIVDKLIDEGPKICGELNKTSVLGELVLSIYYQPQELLKWLKSNLELKNENWKLHFLFPKIFSPYCFLFRSIFMSFYFLGLYNKGLIYFDVQVGDDDFIVGKHFSSYS